MKRFKRTVQFIPRNDLEGVTQGVEDRIIGMATVAEFTINADDFPLGEAFKDMPGVRAELERVVPTSEVIIPYIWVQGVKGSEIKELLQPHPHLEKTEIIDEVNEEYLIKLSWKRDYQGILKPITETDVTLLSAFGTEEKWTFEIRGDERESISEFQQYCIDNNVPITITSIHALSPMQSGGEYDLTDTQREALILAHQRGYFQSPREATLDDIAEELNITGQSLGSRLRGGTHRLIGSTLIGS